MGKSSELGHKIALRPAEAKQEILAAYRRARCDKQEAARLLGVSSSRFYAFVKALGLVERMASLKARAKKEGWHHRRNSVTRRPEVRQKLRAAWAERKASAGEAP